MAKNFLNIFGLFFTTEIEFSEKNPFSTKNLQLFEGDFSLSLFSYTFAWIAYISAARGNTGNAPPPEIEKIVVDNCCYFRRLYL